MKIIYPSSTLFALHVLHYTILYRQVNKKKPAGYLRSIPIIHTAASCRDRMGTAYAPFVASLVRTQGGVTVTGCIGRGLDAIPHR